MDKSRRSSERYIYIDEDEKIQFMDQYLEEIVKEQELENKDDLRKILKKIS